jgi:hypothetical protein
MREGERYLYKFGWFGTSFGGLTSWVMGKKYEVILRVVKEGGKLCFREDNGILWGVIDESEPYIKKLIKL